jgi:polyferredoxin
MLEQLQKVRLAVQVGVFIILNAKLFGLGSTGVVVPYLHATEAPLSVAHGAIESIEYAISHGAFPLLSLGIVLLSAITIGKLLCAWACPFGLAQDLVAMIPAKKTKLSPSLLANVKDIKYAVLGFSLLGCWLVAFRRASFRALHPEDDVPAEIYPLGVLSDSPFSVFSPAATLFAYLPWMALWNPSVIATAGLVGWIKIGLLCGLLAPSALIPRFFCRYICPIAAVADPLAKFRVLKIARAPKSSRDEINKVMAASCPMGVSITSDESETIDHPACIHCGACIAEVPAILSQRIAF